MKKLRNGLVNVLMVIVSTVLTVLLVDFGLRLLQVNNAFAVQRRPDAPLLNRLPPGRSQHIVVSGDLKVPGDLVLQAWQTDIITDAYGFRNETIPDEVDTIVLGDSFGMMPVTQSDLVASRLGECGRGVYNLSMVAHSPWQEYATLILEQDRLNIKPGAALVWMLYSGNDLDDLYMPVYGDSIKTELTRPDPGQSILNTVAGSPLLRMLVKTPGRVFGPDGGQEMFYELYLPRAQRTADDIRAHPNYPLLRDTFRAMSQNVRDRQMSPLVIVVPSKEEVDYYQKASGFGEVIGDLAAENDMPFIDLTPDFLQRASQGEILYLVQDTHWNPYAQQVVSRQLCDTLADH